mmetsp:Transcript_128457/g.363572  ORF Transcript_128457/g.363572 Transcript_128457/m.363572 type:complete len:261 (-) Transcript_128457:1121-1903(-)
MMCVHARLACMYFWAAHARGCANSRMSWTCAAARSPRAARATRSCPEGLTECSSVLPSACRVGIWGGRGLGHLHVAELGNDLVLIPLRPLLLQHFHGDHHPAMWTSAYSAAAPSAGWICSPAASEDDATEDTSAAAGASRSDSLPPQALPRPLPQPLGSSTDGSSFWCFLSKNSRSSSSSASVIGAMAPRSMRSQFSRKRGIQYDEAILATQIPMITAKHTLFDTDSHRANTSFSPMRMRMAAIPYLSIWKVLDKDSMTK